MPRSRVSVSLDDVHQLIATLKFLTPKQRAHFFDTVGEEQIASKQYTVPEKVQLLKQRGGFLPAVLPILGTLLASFLSSWISII